MNHDEELRLKSDRKLSAAYILKRNFKYLKPEIWRLVLSMVFMVVNVLLSLVIPLLLGEVVNIIAPEKPPVGYVINFNRILDLAILYVVITLVSQISRYFQSMMLQHAGQRIVYDMRMEVFSHIESMSQNQFNEMPVGSLVTRVASYTANMSDLFTNTIMNVLRNFLTVLGVYIFMFFIVVLLICL